MGARSTGNHPTTTKADGHLLEYFRQTFGTGGGGGATDDGDDAAPVINGSGGSGIVLIAYPT